MTQREGPYGLRLDTRSQRKRMGFQSSTYARTLSWSSATLRTDHLSVDHCCLLILLMLMRSHHAAGAPRHDLRTHRLHVRPRHVPPRPGACKPVQLSCSSAPLATLLCALRVKPPKLIFLQNAIMLMIS